MLKARRSYFSSALLSLCSVPKFDLYKIIRKLLSSYLEPMDIQEYAIFRNM